MARCLLGRLMNTNKVKCISCDKHAWRYFYFFLLVLGYALLILHKVIQGGITVYHPDTHNHISAILPECTDQHTTAVSPCYFLQFGIDTLKDVGCQ